MKGCVGDCKKLLYKYDQPNIKCEETKFDLQDFE